MGSGRLLYATNASPGDRFQSSRRDLEDPLEFETLISDLSSRFVNLPAGEVDREIQGALRGGRAFLGVDFAVIWQGSSAVPCTGAFTATYHHDSEEGALEAHRIDTEATREPRRMGCPSPSRS
jgi:hypothetical protein